jgi:hypothetical protein
MAGQYSVIIPPVASALLSYVTQTMLGSAQRGVTPTLVLPSLKQRARSIVERRVPITYIETAS